MDGKWLNWFLKEGSFGKLYQGLPSFEEITSLSEKRIYGIVGRLNKRLEEKNINEKLSAKCKLCASIEARYWSFIRGCCEGGIFDNFMIAISVEFAGNACLWNEKTGLFWEKFYGACFLMATLIKLEYLGLVSIVRKVGVKVEPIFPRINLLQKVRLDYSLKDIRLTLDSWHNEDFDFVRTMKISEFRRSYMLMRDGFTVERMLELEEKGSNAGVGLWTEISE
jgi:hypothetical protein